MARITDRKLIGSWCGHHNFHIIGNNVASFEEKINSVLDTVLRVVGMPVPSTLVRKFLLVSNENTKITFPDSIKSESFSEEEVFLLTYGKELDNRIRKVGKNETFIYNHGVGMHASDNGSERIIKRRQIAAREFTELLDHQDSNMKILHKERNCFIYEN